MGLTRAVLVSTIASVCLTASALAADDKPDTPSSIRGGKVVSVDEAKGLLDKKAASFFDTRNALNFGKGHVPGATIVSYKEKSDFSPNFDASQDSFELAKLPGEKSAQIVFYSDGPILQRRAKRLEVVQGGHSGDQCRVQECLLDARGFCRVDSAKSSGRPVATGDRPGAPAQSIDRQSADARRLPLFGNRRLSARCRHLWIPHARTGSSDRGFVCATVHQFAAQSARPR